MQKKTRWNVCNVFFLSFLMKAPYVSSQHGLNLCWVTVGSPTVTNGQQQQQQLAEELTLSMSTHAEPKSSVPHRSLGQITAAGLWESSARGLWIPFVTASLTFEIWWVVQACSQSGIIKAVVWQPTVMGKKILPVILGQGCFQKPRLGWGGEVQCVITVFSCCWVIGKSLEIWIRN